MKHCFKNLRRPCTRVDNIDDKNRKTGTQNIAVSSAFSMKNLHDFPLVWGINFFQIFSLEPPSPDDIENGLK